MNRGAPPASFVAMQGHAARIAPVAPLPTPVEALALPPEKRPELSPETVVLASLIAGRRKLVVELAGDVGHVHLTICTPPPQPRTVAIHLHPSTLDRLIEVLTEARNRLEGRP